MDEAASSPDPSHLLSCLEDILDSDPELDEVGFIHPMQFTAFTEEVHSAPSSSSEAKRQLEYVSHDTFFWHHGHKLGISTLVLVPLYRAARDAFMDAYNRYVTLCKSRAKTVDEPDGNELLLDVVEKEVMKHSKALLLLSCDFGTAWNSRKVIVSKKQLLPMFMDELLLSALVLSYSPKSERAWSHRRWGIKMVAGKCANIQEIVGRESELVKTLAEKSKMNYRAWNHRCWLVSYMSNSQVLLELKNSRNWAGLHVADNSSFHYRARLLLQMMANLQPNEDGLPGAEFHKTWKDELDWIGMLIRRYLGREALWLHRRFLSLVWMKQHLSPSDDQIHNYTNSLCTSCDISVFVKDEMMLLDSCINFPQEEDGFGDYRAQAIHAATYIMWLAKQMPMSFGAELRRNSKYEVRLRLLVEDAGKSSSLWESLDRPQLSPKHQVLPAPSSTEHDSISVFLAATTSCGGSTIAPPFSSSSSSSSEPTSSSSLALLARDAGITGTLTGADWGWNRVLPAGRGGGGGRFGIIVIAGDLTDAAGEVDEEEERETEVEALWLKTGRESDPDPDLDLGLCSFRAARMP